jgi:hypothetical protein
MGKTCLIHHVFNQENIKNNYITIYCDLYQTGNLSEFAEVFGNAVLNRIEKTPDRI